MSAWAVAVDTAQGDLSCNDKGPGRAVTNGASYGFDVARYRTGGAQPTRGVVRCFRPCGESNHRSRQRL